MKMMAMLESNIEFNEVKNRNNSKRFIVRLAEHDSEIEQCLRLRYRIFAREMGARLSSAEVGIDRDRFDEFCQHRIAAHIQATADNHALITRQK